MRACVCECVSACVCVHACVRVRACACVCACVRVNMSVETRSMFTQLYPNYHQYDNRSDGSCNSHQIHSQMVVFVDKCKCECRCDTIQ